MCAPFMVILKLLRVFETGLTFLNKPTMVNTFCVAKDVEECARALDWRRLGKQRVEAKQIYDVVTGVKQGWKNHPACKMWMGYQDALALYTNAMITEWIGRGYRNTMPLLKTSVPAAEVVFPAWFGWRPVVQSHQASLNRKDPLFYKFEVEDSYTANGYFWPSTVPEHVWGLQEADVQLAPITVAKPRPSKKAKTV